MDNPTAQQNFIGVDKPQLKDVLNLLRTNIFSTLRCHAIGTVQDFNSSNQTATATINYKKTYFNFNQVTKLYESTLVDYPVIIDSPVIFLGGGTSYLNMPVQAGDECLVLFNDRDIDTWFASGAGSAVATTRLHSFSDAIILVGLRNATRSISSFDTVRAVISDGDAKVGINPSNSKASILNNTTDLNTAIQNAVYDAMNSATYGGGSGLDPGQSATIKAAVAAALGGLLE